MLGRRTWKAGWAPVTHQEVELLQRAAEVSRELGRLAVVAAPLYAELEGLLRDVSSSLGAPVAELGGEIDDRVP